MNASETLMGFSRDKSPFPSQSHVRFRADVIKYAIAAALQLTWHLH